MLYQFNDTKNSRLIEKTFLKEVAEIYSILSELYNPKLKSEQMSFDDLEAIEKIIKIGLIDNEEELDGFRDLLDKKGPCSYSEFIDLIKLLIMDYPSWNEDCPINNYSEAHRASAISAEEKAEKPTIIDLFSGAGGMSLGFKQEGFKIAFANDIEQSCIETYIHNHPEVPKEFIVQEDIDNLIPNLKDKIRFKNIDIIIGGPPCQGFSNANRQRLIDDPRNKLYKSYVQVVDQIKPKFFVMENVEGMKNVSEQVREDFEKIGYQLEYKVLNAFDFGVPQNRKRLIFIGNNIGIDNSAIFDELLKISERTEKFVLEDALQNLRSLTALRIKNATELDADEHGKKIAKNEYIGKENKFQLLINDNKLHDIVYNHKARYNNDRDIEIFSRLNQGDRSDDPKIADIMPYSNRNDIFKDKYFKLENSKPCKTITAHMKFDCNMYIHPTQARGLTPREAARVQTYPDNYFFKGPYTKMYMQIGNSVPPLMSRKIASVLKKYI